MTGVAAHITAAASGGPRYDPNLTQEERKAPSNGIWLCARCGMLIDCDSATYSVHEMLDWKNQAIRRARRALETGRTVLPGPTSRVRQHDAEVFARSDKTLSESGLRSLMSELDYDRCLGGAIGQMKGWLYYFSLESNQYLIPSLRERNGTCWQRMQSLRAFLGNHFFTEGKSYALYPELRRFSRPDDEVLYEQYSKSLYALKAEVLDGYLMYRRAVKQLLAV